MQIKAPFERWQRVAARTRLDWHLLAVWLLTLPALTPLFQPTLTRSADGLLHLYRVVALDDALQQGVLFPRWLPDLAFGYGMPLFVFYAPLSYYLTAAFNLVGFGPVAAVNASLMLAVLVAATGMYLLVRDLAGPRGAILAAVAYVYAPYQLYSLLWRGSLPMVWAGALFPLAFWALGRWHHPRYIPLAALMCGLALLTHNVSLLLFFPLLGLYLLVKLSMSRDWIALPKIAAAVTLGVMLAAFFLGPAIIERENIQLERVITPPDFDYRSNFVDPADLLAFLPPANTGLLNPDLPFTLGPIHTGLTVIALLLYALRFRQTEISIAPVLFATLSLIAVIFMMLPASVSVWNSIPSLAYLQQPHRLLSVAAFLMALVIGGGVAATPPRWAFGFTVVGCVLIIGTATPTLYAPYYDPLPHPPTLDGLTAYERASGTLGTTSFGEYLPVAVTQIPTETPSTRVDASFLPDGATITPIVEAFNRVAVQVTTPENTVAVFQAFYFPGWQATVSGYRGAIVPISERGLVGVLVPSGDHRVVLWFGNPPLWSMANAVSLLALSIIVVLWLMPRREAVSIAHLRFAPGQVAAVFAVGVVLLSVKLGYLDHFDNPLKRVTAQVETPREEVFGSVRLLGYDLEPGTQAESGTPLELTLYWQATEGVNQNYSALTHLVDESRNLYAGQDNLHPGGVPMRTWEPWGFVRDAHRLVIPPGTPPGDYFVNVGLYHPGTWARLPVTAGDTSWGDVVALPVTVTPPQRQPTLTELGITRPLTASTESIRLLGLTPERESLPRHDFLRVALFWEALTAPQSDYYVMLRLVDETGQMWLSQQGQPSHGRYPTLQWSAGERVRDAQALWLPMDLPPGAYHLEMQLVDDTQQIAIPWLALGMWEVIP